MKAAVKGKIVYLSGSISADPDYKKKFNSAALLVRIAGAKKVLNPVELPHGWDYDEYMEHCMLMVRRCDVIVLLPCWTESPGAKAEKAYAESLRRLVVDFKG